MGQVFDIGPLEFKFDQMHSNVSHFSQMESLSSESIEDEEEDDWGELKPWIPCRGKFMKIYNFLIYINTNFYLETLQIVRAQCPNIRYITNNLMKSRF